MRTTPLTSIGKILHLITICCLLHGSCGNAQIYRLNWGSIFRAGRNVAIGGASALLAEKALSALSSGEAAYSLTFQLNRADMQWVRIWGWPDIFPLIQIEGDGQYILPEIIYNYEGSRIIWNFKIKKIPPGRLISIYILDDHSGSNQMWNNILRTHLKFDLGANSELSLGITASCDASGEIHLLESDTVISGPKMIANYVLKSKSNEFFSQEWHNQGVMKNSKGEDMGSVTFSQFAAK